MPRKSYAEVLADFVESVDLNKVPFNVIEHTKFCILDWFGVTIAGSAEKDAITLVELFKELRPRDASIIGFDVKIPVHEAAYVNGVISHMIELDDIHREAIIHPGVPVIPAALALSEKLGRSGETLVEAVIAGYEVEIAIGKAVNPSHYKYWHSTGTCGTFGSAAAASKVLGLGAEMIVSAFGIAGTHAAGLIETFGTSSKPLNPGRAARDGVLAALLAERGFVGPRTIFEGDKGFFRATSSEIDYDKGFRGLGEKYEILMNSFKRHSSCGHTHAAIDAILSLRGKTGLRPVDVVEVEVGTYSDAVEIVGRNYEPKTPLEAKFSLPYCIAVAMLDGVVSLRQFTFERMSRADVKDFMKKVKVYVDKDVNALYPRKLGARVRVKTANGDVYEELVEVAKGNPENPLTRDELIDKFIQLASMKLSHDKCTELIRAILRVEKLSDVRELIEIMAS
ncbi:MAG: MmgE/PrpD family protein [Candidatus Nezhaarchaeota archaeon]|nr:MmgE/PrpD family protein [Candidatus Nezhaarchaeota archaeon]MCX8142352.1 MmgE/PrpD family protein [Candidatus Nezhaarchaeota archaeon]MDW8050675.1 MmgE/PrpD family protein [Nitrososphaerota archaeon]